MPAEPIAPSCQAANATSKAQHVVPAKAPAGPPPSNAPAGHPPAEPAGPPPAKALPKMCVKWAKTAGIS